MHAESINSQLHVRKNLGILFLAWMMPTKTLGLAVHVTFS
jgi:hypothetical protein